MLAAVTTGYTLLDNPNPHMRQYRAPRREQPSGVVAVHTAENAPDLSPPDDGAENVAGWISRRTDPGSYHRLCDSDSIVALVPWDFEAWHDATGTNAHSVGISAATRAAEWESKPQAWRDGCVGRMAFAAADYAHWLASTHGIVIPARRVTADEARARVPGFVSHAELDPGRRSDPGVGFPWDQFLATFTWLRNPTSEEDMLKDETLTVYPSGDRSQPSESKPASDVVAWAHDSAGRAEAYGAAALTKLDELLNRAPTADLSAVPTSALLAELVRREG
jgi:hypothetical protein